MSTILSAGDFFQATYDGDFKAVQGYLFQGGDINVKCDNKNSALHIASAFERKDIQEFLIMNGAKVDAVNDTNTTSLHMAAFNGYLDVAQQLLAHNASISTRDTLNQTALHCAIGGGKESAQKCKTVELLLNYGADPTAENFRGFTPLAIARRKLPEVVSLIESCKKPSSTFK